jgi:hypothetical protein
LIFRKWWDPQTDKNCCNIFLPQKLLLPIFEIVFDRSLYLFHFGIQNNAVGDKSTFASLLAEMVMRGQKVEEKSRVLLLGGLPSFF